MDGSGRLLQKQAKLWQLFNLRCLSIAPESISDWDTLADRVLKLIYQELANHPHTQGFLGEESFVGCLAL